MKEETSEGQCVCRINIKCKHFAEGCPPFQSKKTSRMSMSFLGDPFELPTPSIQNNRLINLCLGVSVDPVSDDVAHPAQGKQLSFQQKK